MNTIGRDEAFNLLKKYNKDPFHIQHALTVEAVMKWYANELGYGEDAEYSYKKQVTVGDKEYYDFSVSGDNVSSTDVLVSVDGQDVIGGTQNDDGSWSFDQ